MSTILIKNARYIITPGKVLENKNILIEDGKITSLTKSDSSDHIIDGEGMLVMPGLINAHTHAAMSLFRGYADDIPLQDWLNKKIFPAEAKLTSDDICYGTLLSCIEMIKSGTTAFVDMYMDIQAIVKAVQQTGMRACVSNGVADNFDPSSRDKCLKKAADSLKFVKGLNDSKIVPSLGPHALYNCSQNLLLDMKQMAEDNKVKLQIHLAETKQETKDIYKLYSLSPFEVMQRFRMLGSNYILSHCVWLTSENVMDLAKSGSYVVHNPVSNLKLGSGIAPVNDLMHAGANVCLGTDGAASNNSLDMFETMKIASLLHKGHTMNPLATPAQKILEAATINAAGIFGINNKIEVGGVGDLVLIDIKKPHLTPMLNPVSDIVYSMKSSDVDTVIIDGKIVMKDKKIKGVNEEELYEKINKSVARLVA